MSNYKCTPIPINASDTTEYLGTKDNLASPILQSTVKLFWSKEKSSKV